MSSPAVRVGSKVKCLWCPGNGSSCSHCGGQGWVIFCHTEGHYARMRDQHGNEYLVDAHDVVAWSEHPENNTDTFQRMVNGFGVPPGMFSGTATTAGQTRSEYLATGTARLQRRSDIDVPPLVPCPLCDLRQSGHLNADCLICAGEGLIDPRSFPASATNGSKTPDELRAFFQQVGLLPKPDVPLPLPHVPTGKRLMTLPKKE